MSHNHRAPFRRDREVSESSEQETTHKSLISGLAGASLLRPASGGTAACAVAKDGCGGGEGYEAHLSWWRGAATAAAVQPEPARRKLGLGELLRPRRRSGSSGTAEEGQLRSEDGRRDGPRRRRCGGEVAPRPRPARDRDGYSEHGRRRRSAGTAATGREGLLGLRGRWLDRPQAAAARGAKPQGASAWARPSKLQVAREERRRPGLSRQRPGVCS